MTEESFVVPAEISGERLDKAISLLLPSVSRSMAQKLIGEQNVVLNGSVAGKSAKVKLSDELP